LEQLSRWLILTLFTLPLLGLNGCQTDNTGNQVSDVSITPGYVSLEERFQTEIVNIGLEKLGYRINNMRELEPAVIHTDLAQQGLDYTAAHWEQSGRQFYLNSGGDEKLEKVGVIVDDAIQGYLIDRATAEEYNITNLEQLQDPEIAQQFDSNGDGKANLIGCNLGWACETIINHHLQAYGLEETVTHDSGRYFALMADTMTRYQQGESILYYTYTPLWTTSVLVPGEDVIWLEVPETSLPDSITAASNPDTTYQGKNLGFPKDRIMIVANQAFANANPKAIAFMEQVSIPKQAISKQNQRIREGENSPADIRRHAENWVANHQQTFQQWLEAAKE